MDNFWKDKDGRVVIWQRPNLPLTVWFVTYLLGWLPFSPLFLSLLDTISFGAIFTWAWLEISSGVNTFRRILGLIVLVMSVLLRLKY